MAHAIHRSPAYLSRSRYSYCFRMRVPDDLQRYIGKKELRYSLRTGYVGKAKVKARRLAGGVQQLFQDLREDTSRLMELSDKQIRKLVLKHLKKVKEGYDSPSVYSPDEPPPFEDELSLRSYLDTLELIKGDLRLEIAKGDLSRVMDDAKALMQELIPEGETIDETSVPFLKLCEGLLRAELKGVDYHKARLSGEYSDDLEHSMSDALSTSIRRPVYQPAGGWLSMQFSTPVTGFHPLGSG